ncbi:hypothetical protein T10_5582 [Trichinella papuae]|uniref:Uncharacterized protein n=1 Tax=Trichinella papuae TaxID=268474 RepID=A0A0V1MER2_9BILA|nr:hypothetical protein T10_5582 [Trichinella papuae]
MKSEFDAKFRTNQISMRHAFDVKIESTPHTTVKLWLCSPATHYFSTIATTIAQLFCAFY